MSITKKVVITIYLLLLIVVSNSYAYDPKAKQIATDTSGFNKLLSSADTEVQHALNTINNLTFVNEQDPVFTAWDRSSGVNITSSHVTDVNWTALNNKADYQFAANNFNGTGSFNTTNNISATYYRGNGSLLTGIYPSAGLVNSTGAGWGTSIADNSSNWNTAYGWGNHASAGYAKLANISAVSPITYNNTTGVINWTNSNNYTTLSNISGSGYVTYNSTTGVIGWTNGGNYISLTSLSPSGYITYNSVTGVIGWSNGGSYISTVSVASPITGNGVGLPISISQANASVSGYLDSGNFTIFNNKGTSNYVNFTTNETANIAFTKNFTAPNIPYATFSRVINYPVVMSATRIWKIPRNMTITSTSVSALGGTSITGNFNIMDQNGTNIGAVNTDLTASAGVTMYNTSFANSTVTTNQTIGWHTTSTSGQPTTVLLSLNGNYTSS